MYEVHFSSSIKNTKACYLFLHGSLEIKDILWETPCVGGLNNAIDPVKKWENMSTVSASKAARGLDNYSRWHAVVGHISSDNYQKLSASTKDVPNFPRSVTDAHHCVPCMTAKMKKAPVKRSEGEPTPMSDVHFDVLGPFTATLGGNYYPLHLIEPQTANSDVHLIQNSSQVCQIVKDYIAHVENNFSMYGWLQGEVPKMRSRS